MSHRATSWAGKLRTPGGVQKKRARYLWDKTAGHCAYCGVEFVSPVQMTVDHVVPRAVGGSNDLHNKMPCCKPCNATKGKRSLEYLREVLQRRLHGRPAFTPEQKQYLDNHAFNWPEESRYEFYWERLGNAFDGGENG